MFKGPNTREFQECIVFQECIGINIFNKSTMGMKDSPYSRKQKNKMGRKISQGHIWGKMWLFPKESYICELSWLKIYHFKYIFIHISIYIITCVTTINFDKNHISLKGNVVRFLRNGLKQF